MPVFRVELRSSRRRLRVEKDRVIFNPKNDAELARVLSEMASRAGVTPAGHKLVVIDTSGRRWKKIREITT
jgi:hypothetical protein